MSAPETDEDSDDEDSDEESDEDSDDDSFSTSESEHELVLPLPRVRPPGSGVLARDVEIDVEGYISGCTVSRVAAILIVCMQLTGEEYSECEARCDEPCCGWGSSELQQVFWDS